MVPLDNYNRRKNNEKVSVTSLKDKRPDEEFDKHHSGAKEVRQSVSSYGNQNLYKYRNGKKQS